MTIFAVVAIRQEDVARLASAVASLFEGKYFVVAHGHFLVNAASGTAQEIANQLKLVPEGNGQAIVYSVAGYFGYGPNTVWEWLRANMTSGGAGG
jgi:hypothetical protein